MKTLRLLAPLTLATLSVRRVNHFAGFALSNSVGGTASYTCRTQAQVSEAFNLIGF